MKQDIIKAIDIFNSGGIVIYPTDTAYGIGCRIDNQLAIEKLFRIRKRPLTQPTPLLFDSLEMIKDYVLEIPKSVEEKLINKYWPGALTIIFYANEIKVPSLVRGGTKSVGIRIPGDNNIRKIINRLGVPILGPSANFHGLNTPFRKDEIDKSLSKLVDLVIYGKDNLDRSSSTVIDTTINPWKIVRNGKINIIC